MPLAGQTTLRTVFCCPAPPVLLALELALQQGGLGVVLEALVRRGQLH